LTAKFLRMSAKEPAGGAVPAGLQRVPVEWAQDGSPLPIPVTTWDPATLDTLEDIVVEEVRAGRPIAPILDRWRHGAEMDLKLEGFRTCLDEILHCVHLDAAHIKLKVYQLAFVSGLDIILNLSGPAIAENLGISKQAFFQGVESLRERLGGRAKAPNMRDKEARANMRARGYRANIRPPKGFGSLKPATRKKHS